MDRTQALQRISATPGICGGRPCIKGTRIAVELVLANLGEGISRFELLQAYPSLSDKDIDAALAFAAELSRMTHESLPFEEPVR